MPLHVDVTIAIFLRKMFHFGYQLWIANFWLLDDLFLNGSQSASFSNRVHLHTCLSLSRASAKVNNLCGGESQVFPSLRMHNLANDARACDEGRQVGVSLITHDRFRLSHFTFLVCFSMTGFCSGELSVY